MPDTVRQAHLREVHVIASVLEEARLWLADAGRPMWDAGDVSATQLAPAVEAGEFFIASENDDILGVVRLQREDPEFWPDVPAGQALYLHKLAVRRSAAGTGVAEQLLRFAFDHAAALSLPYVRLDCDANRHAVRALYQRLGFKLHDYRAVGPHFVARYARVVARPARDHPALNPAD